MKKLDFKKQLTDNLKIELITKSINQIGISLRGTNFTNSLIIDLNYRINISNDIQLILDPIMFD